MRQQRVERRLGPDDEELSLFFVSVDSRQQGTKGDIHMVQTAECSVLAV